MIHYINDATMQWSILNISVAVKRRRDIKGKHLKIFFKNGEIEFLKIAK